MPKFWTFQVFILFLNLKNRRFFKAIFQPCRALMLLTHLNQTMSDIIIIIQYVHSYGCGLVSCSPLWSVVVSCGPLW